jgi:KinB signaling pathway activation protein
MLPTPLATPLTGLGDGSPPTAPVTGLTRWYLRVVAALTVISALGQLWLPEEVGTASAWGVAPGWQREIACWNLAVYVIIARTIRKGDRTAGRTVAMGLILLQFLAATNHAVALSAHTGALNLTMAAVNYVCVAFGVVALRRDGDTRDLQVQESGLK